MSERIIEFFPEEHLYKVDGFACPGVSSILKRNGITNIDGIPQRILDTASDFGTKVHKACQLWDKGNLRIETLDARLLAWLEGWINFCRDFEFEIHAIEQPVFSNTHFYVGTLDRRGTLKKFGRSIVDIKTSTSIMPGYKCQARAYRLADSEGTVVKEGDIWKWTPGNKKKCTNAIIVQLVGAGNYKIVETSATDELCFASAANVTSWKKLNKIKENEDE